MSWTFREREVDDVVEIKSGSLGRGEGERRRKMEGIKMVRRKMEGIKMLRRKMVGIKLVRR